MPAPPPPGRIQVSRAQWSAIIRKSGGMTPVHVVQARNSRSVMEPRDSLTLISVERRMEFLIGTSKTISRPDRVKQTIFFSSLHQSEQRSFQRGGKYGRINLVCYLRFDCRRDCEVSHAR